MRYITQSYVNSKEVAILLRGFRSHRYKHVRGSCDRYIESAEKAGHPFRIC